jgi:tRNA A37 methylthiotransferase MiaB
MTKAFIYTSSCERRKLDAKRIRTYLIKNGYTIINRPDNADIIIFIGCAVLDKPTDISLKKIKEFQKYNAELIVAGCLPAIESDALSKIFNGKILITEDLNKYPEKLDQIFYKNKIPFRDIGDENTFFRNININNIYDSISYYIGKIDVFNKINYKIKMYILKQIFGEIYVLYRFLIKQDFSYQIRVSWGCPEKCSYCSINKAIGSLQSKTIDQCIKEFKKGLTLGYKNIVLTGDNVGAYGIDIDKSFTGLLDKITDIPGNYNIMILNFHPRWVIRYIDNLEKILIKNKITCIDIPIQSGNERILKLMNRYSDIEKIKDTCIRIKKITKQKLILGTDIIIGFPTETEKEFNDTLNFIKEVDFHIGTAIKYSCKIGTKAENIKEKVNEKEINKRFNFAKKYLKKLNYKVMYLPGLHYFVFYKKK